MIILRTVQDLQKYLQPFRNEGKKIGFTPTMGALHRGHISLIDYSKAACDISVCCIFVNPTQFNEQSDLDKYPKTFEADVELLTNADADILFFPDVLQVYPKGLNTEVELDFGDLEFVMEGEFRPGHFTGMAQVVKRLLDIVQPHSIYMGQKDIQQAAIIEFMLHQLKMRVEICVCPIVREEHGLAMSSRNARLELFQKMRAGQLYKSLCYLNESFAEGNELTKAVEYSKKLLELPGFKLEYLQVVDGRTLQPINSWVDSDYIVACLACWVGSVRLIDNKIIKN